MLPSVDMMWDQILARLTTQPGLRFAALFGSEATGRAAAGSDLDLAVSFDAGCQPTFEAQVALAAELSAIACRDVDLVVVEQASTILRREIARRGRTLWNREPGDFIRFQAAAAFEYEDLAPVLETCRRAFLAALTSSGSPDVRR